MKDEKGGQMKNDLDFDELHAAVNKLMDQAQKSKPKREPAKTVAKAVSRPSVKVAERPDAPKQDTKSDVSKKEESKIEVRRAPRAAIEPKRRGMAMDVVQMQKPAAIAPPSVRAARTAPTIQPVNQVKPEPPSPRAPGPTPVPAPATAPGTVDDVSDDVLTSLNMQDDNVTRPETILSSPEQKPAFPDPLDVHGFNDQKDEPKPPEPHVLQKEVMPDPLAVSKPTMQHGTAGTVTPPEAEVKMPAEPQEATTAESAVPQPAPSMSPADSTPFVNAKVEKRPLGAFANTAPAPMPSPTTMEPKTAPTPGPKPAPSPEAARVEVPAAPEELRPEVVAVESAESEFGPSAGPQTGEPLQNLRQMSIPQQYRTDDKEPSKDDRPVFDTKTYHTPLQPVATPKRATGSKAGIILTVILILLLIAAGVGAYFVATGSIDIGKLF